MSPTWRDRSFSSYVILLLLLVSGFLAVPFVMSASAQTNIVVATVPVGTQPIGIAFDSANGDVYVANSGTALTPNGTVSVIDGSTNTVVANLTVGPLADAVAFDPANGNVYVANSYSGTVSVINGSTNTVVATVQVGGAADGLAFDSSNKDIYVTEEDIYVTNVSATSPPYFYATTSNIVSVINGSTNKVVANVTVGDYPQALAFDSGNGDLYVTTLYGTVSVIDGSVNKAVVNITTGGYPDGVAYDPESGDIYVCVQVPIPVGPHMFNPIPIDVAAYNGNVSVIDGSTNAVVATVPVGQTPSGIAFDPSDGDIYVANSASDTVSVIDGLSNMVVASVTVGTGPSGITFDSANGDIYVANGGSNTVSVIPTSPPTSLLPPWAILTTGAIVVVLAATGAYLQERPSRKERAASKADPLLTAPS